MHCVENEMLEEGEDKAMHICNKTELKICELKLAAVLNV
jgi:hypothetical protein